MLILPLVAGVLTLLTLVVGVAAVRNLPVRWACPGCHHATSPVQRPLLRPVSFLIQWRWCPRCHWSGWSRKRPTEVEAEPVVPRTSFEWGDGSSRSPRPRRIFRWKGDTEEQATPVRAESVHPSGFRWSSEEDKPPAAAPRPNPRPKHVPDPKPRPRPSAFRWADDERSEAPGFQWKETEDDGGPGPAEALVALLRRVGSSPDHPSGFRWADGGVEEPDGESELAGSRSGEGDTFGFRWSE